MRMRSPVSQDLGLGCRLLHWLPYPMRILDQRSKCFYFLYQKCFDPLVRKVLISENAIFTAKCLCHSSQKWSSCFYITYRVRYFLKEISDFKAFACISILMCSEIMTGVFFASVSNLILMHFWPILSISRWRCPSKWICRHKLHQNISWGAGGPKRCCQEGGTWSDFSYDQ